MKKIILLFFLFGAFASSLLSQTYCLKVKKESETPTTLSVSFQISSTLGTPVNVDVTFGVTGGGSINSGGLVVLGNGANNIFIGGGNAPVTITHPINNPTGVYTFTKNGSSGPATFTIDDVTGGLGVYAPNRMERDAGCPMNCIISPEVAIAVTTGTNPTCSGTSVTYTATPVKDGGASPTYQWKKGVTNVGTGLTYTDDGTTGGTITCVMTADLSGSFSCVDAALNGGVTGTSNGIIMQIDPASLSGNITGNSTPVCAGTNSTTLTLSGNNGTVLRWESSLDNFVTAPTTISNTTSSLIATNLTATTWYRAVTQSGVCTPINTPAVAVTVNPLPTPVISGNLGLTCSATSTTLGTTLPYSSYLWSTSQSTSSINVNSASTITVTVTDANNCVGVSPPAIVLYLPVTNTTQTTSYATIQAAINAANSNDVITVCAGTYTENLTISGKNGLVIKGPNTGLNNANGTRVAEASIVAASNAPVITVNSAVTSYTIDGFKLVGADYGNDVNGSIIWASGGGTVNNILNNKIEITSNTNLAKRYIWLGPSGSVSSGSSYISGNISHNTFTASGSGLGFAGITMQQWSKDFNINGNKFVGMTGHRNILIWHPTATVVISNNEFYSANDGSNGGSARELISVQGIAPTTVAGGLVIQNNTFSIPGKAISTAPAVNYGANITITNNDFGSVSGLAIQNGGSGTIAATCNWYGTATAGLIPAKISGSANYTPWLIGSGDGAAVGFQPTASCTGTPVTIASATPTNILCGPTTGSIAVTFSGGTGPYNIAWTGGSATGITSPYSITPLLAGAYTITVTDANGSTANATATVLSLPVTNTTQTTYYATIQAAINAANTNDVITICAGTYNEQVLVNKGVTIKGVGVTKPIINFTGTPALASGKLTLFEIAADNVIIDNFEMRVDMTKLTNAVITSGAFGNNLTVKNNSINPIRTGAVATTYGNRNAIHINYRNFRTNNANQTGIVIENNTISYNDNGTTADNTDDAGFRSAVATDEAGLTIHQNTFQTVENDIEVRFGGGGNIVVTGNTFNGAGARIGEYNGGAGTITVTGNTFNGTFVNANTKTALTLFNNYQNKATTVSNNTFLGVNKSISLENYQNVTLSGNTFTPLAAATAYRHIAINTKEFSSSSGFYVPNISATITGNTFNGSGTTGGDALFFANQDNDSPVFGTFTLGSSGSENTFNAGIQNFIRFDNSTGTTNPNATSTIPWAQNLDAQYNKFDVGSGAKLPATMTLTERTSLENALYHKFDEAALGRICLPTTATLALQNAVLSAICASSTTKLKVDIISGTGPFTVVYSDGSPTNTTVAGYVSGTDIIVSPTALSTTYSLVSVTDAAGCTTTTNTGTPIITVKPNPTISSVTPSAASVCAGTGVSFTASGLLNGSNSFSYTVTGPGGPFTGTQVATVSGGSYTFAASPYPVGSYGITINSATVDGCTTTFSFGNTASFIVNPNPTIGGLTTNAVCEGSPATINVAGLLPNSTGTVKYTYPGLASPITVSGTSTATGTYSFTTDPLPLSANGLVISVVEVATASCTTTYPVNTKTVTLMVNPNPTIGTLTTNAVCEGSPATISVTGLLPNSTGTVKYTYLGLASPITVSGTSTATGTYSFATDPLPLSANGLVISVVEVATASCTTTYPVNAKTVTLVVNPKPTLGTITTNPVCVGSAATINVTGLLPNSTGTVKYTYPGLASPIIVSGTSTATGTYSFTTDPLPLSANGLVISVVEVATASCMTTYSVGTNTVTLVVNPLPTPTVAITETSGTTNNDGILCTGASATLDAGAFSAYAWSTTTAITQTISAASAGLYTVTVTDANGCKNSATASITVNPLPTPLIAGNLTLTCASLTTNLSTTTPYSAYSWSNGSTGSPITVGAVTGIKVTVTDANGCQGTSAPVSTQSLLISNTTQSTVHATIQAAIDAASANDVISVCAGTFTENININKPLTLNGANVGISGSGTRTPEAILLNCTIDINNAGNTIIDGFHILRNDGAVGFTNQLELDGGLSSTVQNCIFERNGSNTGQNIRAIATTTAGGAKNIINNKIIGDASGGLFSGHKSWNNGIYVDAGSYMVNMTGNTIMNCRSALNIDNYNNNVVTSGNTFNNNGTHISIGGSVPTTGSFTMAANNYINNAASTMINLSNVAESFRLDITSSTLNGTVFSALSDAALFDVEARMAHKEVSASKKGKVIYKTNNQYVNNITSPATKIDKIQNSVKYAETGDIINLQAGTFNEKVTIDKSLTLQGVNTDKSLQVINGTGLGTASGITINNGITGVTIKNLTVQNFTGASGNANAGIYGIGGNNNLTVENVALLNNPTASGFYANGPVSTVSITNSMVENNGGGARGIVIWNGLKSNINISNNMVKNNTCCGIELQDGDATGVTIYRNTIDIGGGDNAIGLVGLNSTGGTNTISNNIITGGGRFGIELKNPNGGVTVSSNSVSLTTINADVRDRAGIAVYRRGVSGSNVSVPTGVTISGNTVSGYVQSSTSTGFGIIVEGTNHSVTGNTVSGSDVGIQQQGGYDPTSLPGDGDQADKVDNYFGRGNSPTLCNVTVSGNTYSSNGTNERIVLGGGTGTIVITSVATVNDPTDQVVCNGESTTLVTFSGNDLPGVVYKWTNDNTSIGLAASGTSATIPVFPATNSGNTVVIASITVTPSVNGCDGTPQTFTITVNPRPTGAITGTATICNGGSTTLSIAVTGSGTISGTLSDGTTFSGTAPTITVSVSPSTSTTYTIATLTNGTCSAITADLTGSAVVTVNPRPTAIITGTATICNGGSTTLSIAVTGSGTISGTLSGGTTFSGTAPTITVSVSPSTSTTYTIATLTNGTCTAIAADLTGSAVVTVNQRPTAIITGNTTICAGSSATLSIAVTGSGTISGTLSGGTTFSGTAPTITVSVNPSTTTTYTLATLLDANCTAIAADLTGSAVVSVNPTATATISGTTTICSGSTATITFNGTPNTVVTYKIGTGSDLTVTLDNTGTASVTTPATMTSSTISTTYSLVSVGYPLAPFCTQIITGQSATVTFNDCAPKLAAKVFLEGAYDPATGLMTSSILRTNTNLNGRIPTSQPFHILTFVGNAPVDYEGTESFAPSVLTVSGANAIVDWVLIELRDVSNRAIVVQRRAALLQSDGDVVDMDGISPVRFGGLANGNYHVSIRHRLCLATRTSTAIAMAAHTASTVTSTSLNFTNNSNALTGSQKPIGVVYGLYIGDTDRDGLIVGLDISNIRTYNPTIESAFNYFINGYDLDFNATVYGLDAAIARPNNGIFQKDIAQ